MTLMSYNNIFCQTVQGMNRFSYLMVSRLDNVQNNVSNHHLSTTCHSRPEWVIYSTKKVKEIVFEGL